MYWEKIVISDSITQGVNLEFYSTPTHTSRVQTTFPPHTVSTCVVSSFTSSNTFSHRSLWSARRWYPSTSTASRGWCTSIQPAPWSSCCLFFTSPYPCSGPLWDCSCRLLLDGWILKRWGSYSYYLIRRNFRADKFSRIFMQNLMNFFTFAHKIFFRKIYISGFWNRKIWRCTKICPRKNFY